jgi:peptide deformylase
MILPVTVFGDPQLRQVSKPIDKSFKGLNELIDNMFETMYNADGVGLAAPQVGLSIRLFVVDASPAAEEEPDLADFKHAFINPEILQLDGEPWIMEEGCISLPNIRENVSRPESVTLHYFDANGGEHTETFTGYASRIIQHEYDHLQGNLFIDHINPLKRRLLKSKLTAISTGKAIIKYKTKPPRK